MPFEILREEICKENYCFTFVVYPSALVPISVRIYEIDNSFESVIVSVVVSQLKLASMICICIASFILNFN